MTVKHHHAAILRAIASFEQAIQDWDATEIEEGVSPEMRALQLESAKGQLESLLCERAEYEYLLKGGVDQISLNSLEELPPLPETEYALTFFDEGGMHEGPGVGYTAGQMRDYARAAIDAAITQQKEGQG